MNSDEIIRRRTALGLTQKELADAVGAHHITVNRWENGKSRPTGVALRALSQALDELEQKQVRNARDRAARAAKARTTG
jgi:transcriptional regulator with XRE-family HTH domain